MSLFHHPEEEIVVSSPMEGRITFNNLPVTGAKVERYLKWKDEVGQSDFTTTDKNGFFSMPIIKEKAKLPKLSQFVVLQEIKVNYNNETQLLWTLSQMGKESRKLYGELNGKPINFRCDIAGDEKILRLDDTYLITVCEWDSIEQI